jgi:hypothetical protein
MITETQQTAIDSITNLKKRTRMSKLNPIIPCKITLSVDFLFWSKGCVPVIWLLAWCANVRCCLFFTLRVRLTYQDRVYLVQACSVHVLKEFPESSGLISPNHHRQYSYRNDARMFLCHSLPRQSFSRPASDMMDVYWLVLCDLRFTTVRSLRMKS